MSWYQLYFYKGVNQQIAIWNLDIKNSFEQLHMDIFYLVAGLVLILLGANMLTDGSADMARRWGVSDMVVGLTVVAMGTSAPELVISVLSSVENHAGLAIGNVVGSNIFNILMIVGVAALIKPIKVDRMVLTADIPMVMVSSLVLLAFGSAVWLGGSERIISRADGIVLLLLFAIFMRLTFARAHEGCDRPDSDDEAPAKPPMPMWKAAVWTLVGLGALVGGGNWFVDGASGIASSLGMSDAIIGLTVVAVGTSLPELATTIIAAIKGMPGLAIGNVIGSNIFNIFLVLGVSAVVRPLPFGGVTQIDLLVLTGASLLFWIVGRFFRDHTITRSEGALMILLYLAYTVYLIVSL